VLWVILLLILMVAGVDKDIIKDLNAHIAVKQSTWRNKTWL
jgi:hypothetical protein